MKLHSRWRVLPVLAAFAMALGGLVAPDLAHAGMAPASVCGDNIQAGVENCDGTDDANCPGQCQVTCTCGGLIEVYGAWHCGNDFCTWATTRNTAPGQDFDIQNHWLIDRDPTMAVGDPSVNLVVLSFVNPLDLLTSGPMNGRPVGMNQAVVDYFKNEGIRVMLSIGGITFVDDWNTALASDPTQLGSNAAALALDLGVGIEIDYEENTNPDLDGLQSFIDAYRGVHAYDPTGFNHAARLTIDLGAGDRFLIATARRATEEWLATGACLGGDNNTGPCVINNDCTGTFPTLDGTCQFACTEASTNAGAPCVTNAECTGPGGRCTSRVLDYANAIVAGSRNPKRASQITDRWQEHVDGKPQFDPPILPLAPAKFTGGLFVVEGKKASRECNDFDASHIIDTGNFVQTVAPNGDGTTVGMLGYMFWAAECPSARRVCTTPPDSCELGVGAGAAAYDIPIPMQALRQD